MTQWFWFISGMLAGVMATLVGMPLWRASTQSAGRRPLRYAIAVGALATFAGTAALIYLLIGSPRSLSKPTGTLSAHQGVQRPTDGKTQSIEAATASLEARLARDGGNANDWLLLAQSYEFLGRASDAQNARQRAAKAAAPTGGVLPAPAAQVVQGESSKPAELTTPAESISSGSATEPSQSQLERQAKEHSRDPRAWLALADLHRRNREYAAARVAFTQVIRLNAMDAQAWADYADVLGSISGGTLSADAGRAVENALALQPTNAKALWLKASREYQQRRYPQALADWNKLRAVLPADSTDLQLVDANIVETRQLATTAVTVTPTTTPASQAALPDQPLAGTAAEVSGTVSIDGRLALRVARNATLFIYAKAVDSPGPPLAVMRTTAGAWPVTFRLDDTMAMVPSRRLSQFPKVIVEARISSTGQAAPAPGDLYVTSDVLSPAAGQKLALVINREIG